MKKIVLIACVIFSMFTVIGCNQNPEDQTQTTYVMPVWKGSLDKAPENPELGWAYYNTTDKTSYIYDGKDWQVMSKDGSDGAKGTDGKDGKDGVNGKDATQDSSLKDLGESTETVDGVEYKVHSYAEVYANVPYYFTYYKEYYSNDKLRKLYIFNHPVGSDLDCTYNDFEEHVCIYPNKPYELFLSEEDDLYYKKEVTYNENGTINTIIAYPCYSEDVNSYKYEYYENNSVKKTSSVEHSDGYLLETIKLYYENHDLGGGQKDGENESIRAKINIDKSSSVIMRFYEYYESGFIKSYYRAESSGKLYSDTGFLYTYEDNKTKYSSTSESDYATKQEKTSAEIKVLFESL